MKKKKIPLWGKIKWIAPNQGDEMQILMRVRVICEISMKCWFYLSLIRRLWAKIPWCFSRILATESYNHRWFEKCCQNTKATTFENRRFAGLPRSEFYFFISTSWVCVSLVLAVNFQRISFFSLLLYSSLSIGIRSTRAIYFFSLTFDFSRRNVSFAVHSHSLC